MLPKKRKWREEGNLPPSSSNAQPEDLSQQAQVVDLSRPRREEGEEQDNKDRRGQGEAIY